MPILLASSSVLAEDVQQEIPKHYKYYVNLQLDRAEGEVGANEMNRRMEALGYEAQAKVSDQSRNAYYIGLGYHWREYLDLELGYRDLGKVRTELSGSVADIDDYLQSANAVHPRSASGYELAIRPYYPITERINVFGRAGLFRATSDYHAYASPDEAQRDNNSYEWTFSAGLDYRLTKRINIDLHLTQVDVEGERIKILGAGLVYHFGENE
ncbi:MAG: outer membrane beta-barrel protein [Cellvibrio sp.]|uniref:outer membrane beta-barrel protein n=1 Tax=Cellvibrio sp. TaxID=1965322 RepID=UPI00271E2AF9|nr:outer membrane beta-barrel protein [Cellvibrio sp.]